MGDGDGDRRVLGTVMEEHRLQIDDDDDEEVGTVLCVDCGEDPCVCSDDGENDFDGGLA